MEDLNSVSSNTDLMFLAKAFSMSFSLTGGVKVVTQSCEKITGILSCDWLPLLLTVTLPQNPTCAWANYFFNGLERNFTFIYGTSLKALRRGVDRLLDLGCLQDGLG